MTRNLRARQTRTFEGAGAVPAMHPPESESGRVPADIRNLGGHS